MLNYPLISKQNKTTKCHTNSEYIKTNNSLGLKGRLMHRPRLPACSWASQGKQQHTVHPSEAERALREERPTQGAEHGTPFFLPGCFPSSGFFLSVLREQGDAHSLSPALTGWLKGHRLGRPTRKRGKTCTAPCQGRDVKPTASSPCDCQPERGTF